ncbi:MAG: hypothetical protein H7Z72_09200 [Bacteroidetes bacterium]|nr:hypothetical protein [Fibrella sp.]
MKPTKAITVAYQWQLVRLATWLVSYVRRWEQQTVSRRKSQLLVITLIVIGAAGASIYYSFKGSFLPNLTPKHYVNARSK